MATKTKAERVERFRSVAVEFVLIFGGAILYFLVRGLTQGSVERAEDNAWLILRVERWLSIDIENVAQDMILDNRFLVTLANWVYIWGHWPVIIVTLYVLHRLGAPEYRMLRNAMFVSGAIGVVIYMTFPVAPPRLLDPAFYDSVTELSTSYRVLQPPALVNKYAAMPSLHAGWNLLAGIAIYRASRRSAVRAVGLAAPVAMTFAVVLTANHYVLDVVAGEIVALIGLYLSQRWWPQSLPESRTVDEAVDLVDQGEIVDDQTTYTHADEFEGTRQVIHRPDVDVRRPAE